jgi:choline dehydrogenase-like flavoprotein
LGTLESELLNDPDFEPEYGDAAHPMGSTRMSDDPAHGVVDRNGRVHALENLYVTGSSIFPTGGHANPTLTLVALAVRLGDWLARAGR